MANEYETVGGDATHSEAWIDTADGRHIEGFVMLDASGVPTPAPTVQTAALPSLQDTTAGRSTPQFSGQGYRGAMILLDITAVAGTGSITKVEWKVRSLSGVNRVIAAFAPAGMNTTGIRSFLVYPVAGSAGHTSAPASTPIGLTNIVTVTAATDGAGNNVTYSLDVILIP